MRTRLFATTVSTALVAATSAFAANDVEAISVEADLSTIQNYEAAQVWKELPDDLETALAERLVMQLEETGSEIHVDIDEVSLANNFELRLNLQDAVLKGRVDIDNPEGENAFYDLTVTADAALVRDPETGNLLVPEIGSEEFYVAMVDAFADNVAAKLK